MQTQAEEQVVTPEDVEKARELRLKQIKPELPEPKLFPRIDEVTKTITSALDIHPEKPEEYDGALGDMIEIGKATTATGSEILGLLGPREERLKNLSLLADIVAFGEKETWGVEELKDELDGVKLEIGPIVARERGEEEVLSIPWVATSIVPRRYAIKACASKVEKKPEEMQARDLHELKIRRLLKQYKQPGDSEQKALERMMLSLGFITEDQLVDWPLWQFKKSDKFYWKDIRDETQIKAVKFLAYHLNLKPTELIAGDFISKVPALNNKQLDGLLNHYREKGETTPEALRRMMLQLKFISEEEVADWELGLFKKRKFDWKSSLAETQRKGIGILAEQVDKKPEELRPGDFDNVQVTELNGKTLVGLLNHYRLTIAKERRVRKKDVPEQEALKRMMVSLGYITVDQVVEWELGQISKAGEFYWGGASPSTLVAVVGKLGEHLGREPERPEDFKSQQIPELNRTLAGFFGYCQREGIYDKKRGESTRDAVNRMKERLAEDDERYRGGVIIHQLTEIFTPTMIIYTLEERLSFQRMLFGRLAPEISSYLMKKPGLGPWEAISDFKNFTDRIEDKVKPDFFNKLADNPEALDAIFKVGGRDEKLDLTLHGVLGTSPNFYKELTGRETDEELKDKVRAEARRLADSRRR